MHWRISSGPFKDKPGPERYKGSYMSEFIIVAFAVFVVFAILGGVFFLKKDSDGKPEMYLCTQCGEKDCICHSEKDTS